MKHVTQDEFDAWKQHPITQGFRQYCRDRAESMANNWRAGEYNAGPLEQIALVSVEQAAAAQIFDQVAAMDWRDIEQFYEEMRSMSEEDDDDDERDETEA